MTLAKPDRTPLGSLNIARALVGLWQVADIEKDGTLIDPDIGAGHLRRYADAGFDTFDMADHYGTSEIIAGRLLAQNSGETRPLAFTKWCPPPGPMTADIVRVGVQERLDRLGVSRVDLLQIHWWSFEHPAWLDALHEIAELREKGLIAEIGVTNFDADHLRVALSDGIPLISNQVSFSLVDRRAAGPLADVCRDTGVRLFAYGTLCGGFLSDKWLDADDPADIGDWSKMKYRRFIDTIGGWDAFQGILRAAGRIGRKHGVSISNVATRWILEQPPVAATIIGARLGENEHMGDNARLFSFALDAEDHAALDEAFADTANVPGDCGDEYRKPPFLTASGDLSHHLDAIPPVHAASPAQRRGGTCVLSGSRWEDIAGYARAQRIGDRVLVSGTTATHGADRMVAPADAGAQATYVLDKILAALSALGARAEDVVRTRIYITDEADALAVSLAHGRIFGAVKPANSMVVVAGLIGGYKVEIEAEALIPPGS